MIFCAGSSFAQVLLTEGFNSMPPAGWSIQNQAANWSAEFTVQAGGQPLEARLSGTPNFYNQTRLISPYIDLSGITQVRLEFKHMLEFAGSGYSIGVATRNGNGAWSVVWSMPVLATIPARTQSLLISNSNTNQPNFQFCLYFFGNSMNLNGWYIDDVKLFVPPAHDLSVNALLSPVQYQPGNVITPEVTVRNLGLSTETSVPVFMNVYDTTYALVYSNQTQIASLAGGAEDTITLPSFTLSVSNSLFRMEVYTQLASDLNHANDTLKKVISTYILIPKRNVLVELGSVVWCSHCPDASITLDSMISQGKKIVVAGYHGAYGDPFNNAVSNDRLGYYGILGFPSVYFNGLWNYTGSSNIHPVYHNYYDREINSGSPYDVNIYGTHNGSNYNLTIIARKMSPLLNSNLKLHVVLTESHIDYNWFGLTEVNHVVRTMIPGSNGTMINLNSTALVQVPLSFTLNSAWSAGNCELIAFIQDTLTKEVFQVDKVTLTSLQPLLTGVLNGNVIYDNDGSSPLPGAAVTLRQGPFVVATTQANTSGQYSFNSVIPGTYTVTASHNGTWGGANATDCFLILKIFASLDNLATLKAMAADPDGSEYINSIDALTVMKRFVGMINNFTRGNWVFETSSVSVGAGVTVTINIKGLCVGDVDGSYHP